MTSRAPLAFVNLTPGDPAPWFHQRSTGNPRYAFDMAAGRYVVLCFFGSTSSPQAKSALDALNAHRNRFDDARACFFGITVDRGDEQKLKDRLPGIRFFLDFDGSVSRLYGAIAKETDNTSSVSVRQFWMVLDPTLRVMATFPLDVDGDIALFNYLSKLPPPDRFAGFEIVAPVIVLPNVFEPEFCKNLIGIFKEQGGAESGFMREVNGKTVELFDYNHKRRRDVTIEDPDLIKQLQGYILRRVNPELQKVHCYRATRMERYLVSCYSAEDGGHFRPHRDNTTKGTAHRRFAVSINLNGEFEGGELSFPEYGPRTFKAPPGGAVVFAGAMMHAVSPVTKGERYAFLPFLYDEEAAKIREANASFLEGEAANYKAEGAQAS